MKQIISSILLAALLFSACEKENPPVFDPQVSTAVNSAAIDAELLYHLAVYSDAICEEYSSSAFFCWSSIADSVIGNTIELGYDFNQNQIYGCGYYDTSFTGGQMKIRYTAPYSTADTLLVELENFTTLGNTYNGTVLIDRSIVSRPRVIVQSMTAERNGFLYSVAGTIAVDIFTGRHEVSGMCAGSGDQTYTLTIETPLQVTIPLSQTSHFNTGKAAFTNPLQNGAINFGNGTEDNLATFATPDGLRYVLSLQNF
jgi:hypothetical protein